MVGISISVHLVARSIIRNRNNEIVEVVTVKTTVYGRDEDRTVKRTVKGEKASLQLKLVNGKLVHVHCLTHEHSSDWRKTSGKPLRTLYDAIKKNGVWFVTCKGCHRKWTSAGVP